MAGKLIKSCLVTAVLEIFINMTLLISVNYMNDNSKEKDATVPEKKTKYSKAQARQRYKQGKL